PLCSVSKDNLERSKKISEFIDLPIVSDCLSNWDDCGHSHLRHPEVRRIVCRFEHAAAGHDARVDCGFRHDSGKLDAGCAGAFGPYRRVETLDVESARHALAR